MPAARKRTATPPPPPPEDTSTAPIGDEIPDLPRRERTAKFKKLQESIEGFYIMVGGGMSAFPPAFIPMRVKVIGIGLARSCEPLASAWVDLCEEDKRVLKMWESLTALSGWSKVAGEHFKVIGETTPGIAAAMPQTFGQPQPQAAPTGNGGGMDDFQTAMMMAELFRMAQSEQRAPEGQPSSAQPVQAQPQAPPPPPPPVGQEGQPRARSQTGMRPGRGAGIPTPADLGVIIPDQPVDFPSGGSENLNK